MTTDCTGDDGLDADEVRDLHGAVWALYRELAEEIGFGAKIPHADWGRAFARLVCERVRDAEDGDEVPTRAVWMAVAQFGASYRSKHYTDKRGETHNRAEALARKAERERREHAVATSEAVALSNATNGHTAPTADDEAFVIEQLAFPVTVAGSEPKATGETKHYGFLAAEYASAKRLHAEARNWKHYHHFRVLTKPWPDRTPNALLRDKLITHRDLVVPSAPTGLPDGVGNDADTPNPEPKR